MNEQSTSRSHPPRTGRGHRRGRAAAAALLMLGPTLAAAPHAAADEPAALPEVTQFKAADAPCAEPGGDTVARVPWTFQTLGLAGAQEMSRGDGVSVAVLATGVDGGVPALAGAVEGGGGSDCLGYGTFLAGVVAARPLPGSGFVGVAPGSGLLPVPTGDADTGVASAAQIAAGIGTAVAAGARVVLVGTGALVGSPELDAAVEEAEAAGAVVVAPATVPTAAGPFPCHPAQHPAVLSVGSHGVDGAPVLDTPLLLPSGELARVDVVAPGASVLSVAPGGGGHATAGGDGVAAAFAAGSAALLLAREPGLEPVRVRERLAATAYGSALGPLDPVSGSGRIDPTGALAAASGAEGESAAVGEAFVPDPSVYGAVDAPGTVAVVGAAGGVVVLCALAGAVIAAGRERGWRPAAEGEEITPEEDPRPLI
ncbi:S8 family serine peptidase [Nocardiopsis sp. CNT312]|uniref:S8 family serine peptidase n=1 Tax=Nocardiopsis sp. CNT312 TaxID=1137268 RepID=UPI00048E4640|nr:S8 family serine peptidase [Nocardiopsis sp. CNT312]